MNRHPNATATRVIDTGQSCPNAGNAAIKAAIDDNAQMITGNQAPFGTG